MPNEELKQRLHEEIEAINFTDEISVKTALRNLCDFLADAIGIDRENAPEPMLDLWHRADNLNVYDHNQVKMLLKDIVCAINAFHPEGREAQQDTSQSEQDDT